MVSTYALRAPSKSVFTTLRNSMFVHTCFHHPVATSRLRSPNLSFSSSGQERNAQTIVSNSLAYPIAFSMICPLATIPSLSACSTSPAPSLATRSGKYIRPSLTLHPRCWANSTTPPSLFRNNRLLALLMGKKGYAFSEHEAISLRMVLVRT